MDKRIYAKIEFVRNWPISDVSGKNDAGSEEVLHAIFADARSAGHASAGSLVEHRLPICLSCNVGGQAPPYILIQLFMFASDCGLPRR